jgi:uncharacterized protein YjiS (DUF1127 family)
MKWVDNLSRFVSWPSHKIRMRREIGMLSAMSDYELHDIGLTRGGILDLSSSRPDRYAASARLRSRMTRAP